MFDNIGKKCKGLAMVSCILGFVGSLVYGIIICNQSVLLGFLLIIIGFFASWIGCWTMYAIGEAADNSTDLSAVYKKLDTVTLALKESNERLARAEDMLNDLKLSGIAPAAAGQTEVFEKNDDTAEEAKEETAKRSIDVPEGMDIAEGIERLRQCVTIADVEKVWVFIALPDDDEIVAMSRRIHVLAELEAQKPEPDRYETEKLKQSVLELLNSK